MQGVCGKPDLTVKSGSMLPEYDRGVGPIRHGAGSAGASSALGAPGPANAGGLNNTGNETGNSAKGLNTPGTNSAGTANSSGSTSSPGGAAIGSQTVGTSGNPAREKGDRIDGTVTQGPAMEGDNAIRMETSEDSKVDKKIKSICKGC
jgi:hypothetical protein